MQDFKEFVKNNIVIFDGAMGTRLYDKGVFINRVFDELNLSQPALVKEIHQEYLDAGAMVLETNSFGANRFKLAPHGLADKLEAINFQAAKIAKEIAGDKAYVCGSIGPLGARIEPMGKITADEAEKAFSEQASALIAGGVDLLAFETFVDINELEIAVKAARKLTDKPIIASMTIGEDFCTIYGTNLETISSKLNNSGADIIGLNCSVGPKVMFDAMEKLRELTNLPLIAQPNAGLPRMVENRTIYLCNPEYFGEYAKRFIQIGVRILGGCCGTTPDHIKWIANASRANTTGGKASIIKILEVEEQDAEGIVVVPTEQKSTLAKKIHDGKFVIEAELTPPKGCDPAKAVEKAKQLKECGVDVVNLPDGPRASARLSSFALAVLIEREANLETVLHFCCRDRNILGLQSDLMGAYALGIHNVLAITGDPPKVGNYPQAAAVFDIDSIGLVNIVHRLNHGRDLGNNLIGKPTAIHCGVGANPGAIDLDLEIKRFEMKVKAGAEFAVTQPVYDPELLKNFLKRIEHCRIPVIAGIWPLVSLKNAEFMNNEVPGASVPDHIMEKMRKADTLDAQREVGIQAAREALLGVKDFVGGVQVSVPLGRVDCFKQVIEVLK